MFSHKVPTEIVAEILSYTKCHWLRSVRTVGGRVCVDVYELDRWCRTRKFTKHSRFRHCRACKMLNCIQELMFVSGDRRVRLLKVHLQYDPDMIVYEPRHKRNSGCMFSGFHSRTDCSDLVHSFMTTQYVFKKLN